MEEPKYDVFLSYNHRDKQDVEKLAGELRRVGIKAFIDKSLEPGESWIDVLEEALATSATCAICVGPDGLGRWMQPEVNMAIDRAVSSRDGSFRVIPIMLPGSDVSLLRPILRSNWQVVDLTAGVHDSPAFRQLVATFKSPRSHEQNGGGSSSGNDSKGSNGGASTRHRRTIPITFLRQNLPNLRQHIKDRTFTPVLGSGCSLVSRSHSPAWSAIADEMERLLATLKDEEQASQYLRNLAAVRAYDIPLFAHGERLVPTHPLESLTALQAILARLGAALNQLFASVMLESGLAVWDTMSYRLPIPENHPMLHPVSDLLVEACLAASKLQFDVLDRSVYDSESGLGALGLYDHLIEMAAELADEQSLSELKAAAMNDERSGEPSLHTSVSEEITSARDGHRWTSTRSEPVQLAIHQLEWIADALWHTFRYDKAAYPRSDELAFQVSLLVGSAQGRDAGLPTVAQGAEVEADTVAAWFRRYSGSSAPRMLEFYDTLANILSLEFRNFKAHVSGEAGDALKLLWPVAFSTNYDLEMEEALYRAEGVAAFHVVIPVYGFRSDTEEPELGWLFGTVRSRHHDVDEPGWEWFPKARHLAPRHIRGPIVVKLHGSPLHRLPKPQDWEEEADDMPSYERFEHALTLTESQYMESIAWKDPLPDFFNVVLHQDRALYFLGHSVKEWSTRLRVFNHLYRRGEPPHEHPGRVAINRSHDPGRSELLSAIGIERWVGDLEDIPRAVTAMQI